MLPSLFSSPERRQRKNKHFSSAVPREKTEKQKDEGRVSALAILHPQSVL